MNKTAQPMEHRVYLKRTFNTNASQLYQWLVQPELIVQWFGPQNTTVGAVETDVRVGGKYRIELCFAKGGGFDVVGTYEVLQAPHLLAFTFQYEGLPNPAPPSLVTMRLEQTAPGQTTLTFTQAFELEPANMDKRTLAWNFMFDRLQQRTATTDG